MFVLGVEKMKASPGAPRITYAPSGMRPAPCSETDRRRCIDLGKLPKHDRLTKLWVSRLDDATQMLVTHVLRIDAEGRCEEIVASSYRRTSCHSNADDLGHPNASVANTWKVLEEELPTKISEQVSRSGATHIIVLATGWRVDQGEAIRWMAQWRKGLTAHAGEDFRPLFVAITWPSHRWDGLLSFRNKAHDSDEVGLTWANVLVNRTLPKVEGYGRLPIVYLGHSYGARMLSTAVYSGAAIDAPCPSQVRDRFLLVGLQPAFSTGRFAGSGARDSKAYEAYRGCSVKAVYVASENDSAVAFAPSQYLTRDSNYLGGKGALIRAHEEGRRKFFETAPTTAQDKVWLVDGSEHVSNHNDVCGSWIGWKLAMLIDRYADPADKVHVKPLQALEPEGRKRSCSRVAGNG